MMGHRAAKRAVSDEEFEVALQSDDNKKIIKSAFRKFYGLMTTEELKSCGMTALWKTLQKYDSRRNSKFSTRLYLTTQWECLDWLRDTQPKVPTKSLGKFQGEEDGETAYIDDLDILDKLKQPQKTMVEQRYIHNMTFAEIAVHHKLSKEWVRRLIHRSVNYLLGV